MTQFTTELMQALVKKEDIAEVFRKHLEGRSTRSSKPN